MTVSIHFVARVVALMSPKDGWRNPELNDKVGSIYIIYSSNVNGRALRINSWFQHTRREGGVGL